MSSADRTIDAPPSAEHVVDTVIEWFGREGVPWPWRSTRDRWQILVSEVCLQQTQVSRAAPHVERILTLYPTPAALAAAPLADLLRLWQGLGFPRRARNLWLAAQAIAATGWPDDYRDLPGVGLYTAAALRCFADEEPVLPLDINTRRVTSRLFPGGAPSVPERPWAWGQAVMELGQRHCRARASCGACPVADFCPSRGTQQNIASPRQKPYTGSMRQRRGVLLRALADEGNVPLSRDESAAVSLVADGLAVRVGDSLRLA